MSDQTENQEVKEVVTEQAPAGEQSVTNRLASNLVRAHRAVVFVYVLGLLALATAYPAAATNLEIDPDAMTDGFFQGANIVLAMTGLITLMALPYGIQFGFNFLSGVFSKFSNVRFGG